MSPFGALRALAIITAIVGTQCRKEESEVKAKVPERPLVARLDVVDATPREAHPAPKLTADSLTAIVRTALSDNLRFEVPAADTTIDRTVERRTYRLRMRMRMSRIHGVAGALATARTQVSMQMERVAGGNGGLEAYGAEASVTSSIEIPTGTTAQQFWADLAAEAAVKAFHSMTIQHRARERSVDELLSDLDDNDIAVRVAAVRQLGARREVKALPALSRILEDPHHDIVLPAVGALRNLRDPRAVGPLVDSTRGRSTEYLAHVVEALRTIGGVEAEAYLDTIATGHGDPDIRAKATAALHDLRLRPQPRTQP